MFQERLKQEQPIVYQTLFNSIKNDRLAHAYLFSGVAGTPKKETAILLAQSLICSHKDIFACEECEDCIRIKDGNYADIIYLDGKNKAILVDQIRHVLEEFNKTGLEGYNKKIYIIDYVENCNESALNALLKFLEEPAGNDVYAILITEQIDKLLPTIVSRCQNIQFKPLSMEVCYNMCVENGYDLLDAYLLSNLYRDINMIKDVYESNYYETARLVFTQFIEDFTENKDKLRIDMMQALNFLPAIGYGKNDNENSRAVLALFVKMTSLFFSDMSHDFDYDIKWYQDQRKRISQTKYNYDKILKLLRETENKLLPNTNFNLPLIVDQLLYRI